MPLSSGDVNNDNYLVLKKGHRRLCCHMMQLLNRYGIVPALFIGLQRCRNIPYWFKKLERKEFIEGSVSRDFWSLFLIHDSNPSDKQGQVFSNSVSISSRYSISKLEKYDSAVCFVFMTLRHDAHCGVWLRRCTPLRLSLQYDAHRGVS